VPVAGTLIYAGIRLVSVAMIALMLGHGNYRWRHWSLLQWMGSSDGRHYRDIAAHGYAYPPGQLAHASVFSWFPGYPAAIDALAWLPWITTVTAGLIVTAAAGMAAAWGLTTLGLKLTGDPRVSLLLVAIWAVAPGSTVLSMTYAEALFCALAVWALVGVLRRQWLLAGLCSAAAGLVRPTGSALALAVGLAALVAVVTRRDGVRPWFAVVLAASGLLGYLGYVGWRTGTPLGWFDIQRTGWGSQFDAGVSLARFVGRTLSGGHELYDLAVLLTLIGSVVLLVVAVRMRLPWPLLVYAAVVLVTVWCSDGQIHSRVRLIMPAFPLLLLPVALGLTRRRTGTAVAVVVAAALASAWFGGYTLTIWRYAI